MARRPGIAAFLGSGFVRTVVLAFAGVVGAGYALYRYKTRVPPPMLVPVSPEASPPDTIEISP
jgi:hypothetical protein